MPKEDYGLSLQRLFELLRLIPKRPSPEKTISQLQQELGDILGEDVGKRWLERSLNMLKDLFPIHLNDKAKPYGWRWDQGASFDIPSMSLSEAQTLALVEQHLKPLLPASTWESLRGLFQQAHHKLDQHHRNNPKQRPWLNKVRSVPAWQPLLSPRFDPQIRDTVYRALLTDRQFQAGYQKPWQEEPVEYTVNPLGLVQRGTVIYLICVLDDYEDVRVLALHRVRSAEILETPVRCPPVFDLDEAIAEGLLGMGGSLEPIKLVAKFYKPVAQHLLDTPLSEDQTVQDVDTYHLQITATVLHTAQLEWWLRSFGSEVEVLEPSDLREAMAEQAGWIARKYRTEPPDRAD